MADDATPTPVPNQEPPATPPETPADKPAGKSNHLLETDPNSPDPDEAEFQAALKEAEDEAKTAATETPPGETPPATPPSSETPPADAAQHPEPSTPQAPVAALQDERQKRQKAEEEARKNAATAAYWQGVAEGKYPDPRRPQSPEPTQPQPRAGDDKIKAIRSDMKALAAQVDKGTLSTEEYEEKRALMEDEISTIREERIKSDIRASQSDMYLDTATTQLENANSWIKKVPTDELLDLTNGAVRDLRAAGVDYDSIAETPMGDYRLRVALVERAKRFGFDKTYGGGAAPAAETPTAPAPASPTAVPTAEDIAAKKALALHAPPAPQGTGAPANTWTEQRVEEMSDLDLENMSKAELARLGNEMDRQATARRSASPTRR